MNVIAFNKILSYRIYTLWNECFYWLSIVRTIKRYVNGFYFSRSVTMFITAVTSRCFILVDKESSPLCSLINMRCYLEAHFTLERLHAGVYVRMLLEP